MTAGAQTERQRRLEAWADFASEAVIELEAVYGARLTRAGMERAGVVIGRAMKAAVEWERALEKDGRR